MNAPSGAFKDPADLDKIIRAIPEDTTEVIVHCQLSQIRGYVSYCRRN